MLLGRVLSTSRLVCLASFSSPRINTIYNCKFVISVMTIRYASVREQHKLAPVLVPPLKSPHLTPEV